MAYDFFDSSSETTNTLTIDGPTVELPDASYIRDAAMQRDGMDLVLDGPQGTITVEGYFAAESAPDLTAEGGLVLTPKLVNSFVSGGDQYAQAETMSDVSPVGAVDEVSGDATITRTDGSVETISMGTPVYQGDVIETAGEGAVNVAFIDDTSFAVSNNARLAIDEYVFDPATESGTQNFSVLKGVFVFTSGLIGRDDPDDVNIDMPSGSIGIRGTIIAGDADSGEVTVIEGAIVVRDNLENEVTLDDRFETAQIDPVIGEIRNLGQMDAENVSQRFDTLSNVSPTLFSSIDDAANEVLTPDANDDQPVEDAGEPAPTEENFDADGTVDGDADGDVDGTVEEGTGEETGALEPTLEGTEKIEKAVVEEAEPVLQQTVQNKLGSDQLTSDSTGLEANLKEAVQSGDMTVEQAKAILASSDTMTDTQKLALKTTLKEAQNPDTIEPLPEDGSSAGGTGGGPVPVFITDAQSTQTPAQFGPGGRFEAGQTNQPDTDFFTVTSGSSFVYNLNSEFMDSDALTFQAVNPTGATGSISSFNIDANGILSFDVGSIASDGNFSFDVIATDTGGQTATGSITIALIAPDQSEFDGTGLGTVGTADDYVFSSSSVVLGDGGSSFSAGNIFLNNGNDSVILETSSTNTIHLGSGSNAAVVNEGFNNNNNVVFGGSQSDTFILEYDGTTTNHFTNKFYGMDGDDTFILEVNGNMVFDGLKIIGGMSNSGGGDTLSIQDTGIPGVLNFANLNSGPFTAGDITNTTIHGIENIDLTGGDVVMSLSTQNVFEFTDFVNKLTITGDGGDTIQLTGGLFDTGTDDGSFDVYQGTHNGQTVELLVDQTINVI